jgi:hypothetical protein
VQTSVHQIVISNRSNQGQRLRRASFPEGENPSQRLPKGLPCQAGEVATAMCDVQRTPNLKLG